MDNIYTSNASLIPAPTTIKRCDPGQINYPVEFNFSGTLNYSNYQCMAIGYIVDNYPILFHSNFGPTLHVELLHIDSVGSLSEINSYNWTPDYGVVLGIELFQYSSSILIVKVNGPVGFDLYAFTGDKNSISLVDHYSSGSMDHAKMDYMGIKSRIIVAGHTAGSNYYKVTSELINFDGSLFTLVASSTDQYNSNTSNEFSEWEQVIGADDQHAYLLVLPSNVPSNYLRYIKIFFDTSSNTLYNQDGTTILSHQEYSFVRKCAMSNIRIVRSGRIISVWHAVCAVLNGLDYAHHLTVFSATHGSGDSSGSIFATEHVDNYIGSRLYNDPSKVTSKQTIATIDNLTFYTLSVDHFNINEYVLYVNRMIVDINEIDPTLNYNKQPDVNIVWDGESVVEFKVDDAYRAAIAPVGGGRLLIASANGSQINFTVIDE